MSRIIHLPFRHTSLQQLWKQLWTPINGFDSECFLYVQVIFYGRMKKAHTIKHVDSPAFTLRLPDWLQSFVQQPMHPFPTVEERMKFVIELSRRNIREGTGGPFAAAVFRSDTGSLLEAGVNMVLTAGSSVLHAEVVAIMAAQQKLDTHDLSSEGLPPYELVASTEPCAMCMGAVTWSGIRKLVCGARGEDAEEAGFDEGEKPSAWSKALERRGITVLRDICRDQAAAVLRDYAASGGLIYNPHRSK